MIKKKNPAVPHAKHIVIGHYKKTLEDRTKLILDYGMMPMILPAHCIWDHDKTLNKYC